MAHTSGHPVGHTEEELHDLALALAALEMRKKIIVDVPAEDSEEEEPEPEGEDSEGDSEEEEEGEDGEDDDVTVIDEGEDATLLQGPAALHPSKQGQLHQPLEHSS